MERIQIFDTTLRDGEQSPGAAMNPEQKVRVAHALASLGVDVIEAGFPISSDGDFEAVRRIAREVRGPVVAALARSSGADIERAAAAMRDAARPRIHTFIATSDVHMRHKLNMTQDQVLARISESVGHAKRHVADVQFSAEDATRTERRFLVEAVETAIAAGATTVNIPDTVGYTTPFEYYDLIAYLRAHVRGFERVTIAVHCHDDLGMAVANSLAAVKAGARQVECTVNGIGERAGNAALEEIVVAVHTRGDALPFATGIDLRRIAEASRTVEEVTGIAVARNKAVVGANAFAHEAGIHQDGMLKSRNTYEIIDPTAVGIAESTLVMGKHSGRHALIERMKRLGLAVAADDVNRIFQKMKVMADEQKFVSDADLRALATGRWSALGDAGSW